MQVLTACRQEVGQCRERSGGSELPDDLPLKLRKKLAQVWEGKENSDVLLHLFP